MKKRNFGYLLFLIPIFIIIFGWFSTGKIISNNSEENLNILSPSRTAERYSTFWWSIGTGAKIPFQISREGVFRTLSLMERVGIPSFQIQAIFLGSIMFIGTISMYALTKYGFNLSSFIAGLSSLFYLLNIYSLTQVWKRFLYNGMISWAYLPLFLLFWLKWILENKFKWLFLFVLSSLFFTYTFSNPAYLLTFWIPAFTLVLIRAWGFRRDIKKLLKLLGFSLMGFILWIAVNVWWFIPTLFLGKSWTDENISDLQINFNIIHALSQSFPLQEILLLRQSWYLGKENDWYNFYHNPLVYLISIVVLVIAILGFIRLKGNKYRKYLLALSVIGLFISKGTSFPLGYTFYYFIFAALPLTSALRNSYEKFGLVWVLPYSIFFAYGVNWLFNKTFGKVKFFILGLILFLSLGVLVYPMWNGDIFPAKHRVVVPAYYEEANDFLNSQNTKRVFHIPFTTEVEKISYDWGYVGEDPSENLFDGESLTSPNAPLYNKTYKLLPKLLDREYFSNILGLLGAQYVIFHKDNIYPKIDLTKTQKQIESWQGISNVESFGKLNLFRIDPQIVKPRIYAAGKIIKPSSLEEGLAEVASAKWDNFSIFTLEDINADVKEDLVPQISYTKFSNDSYKVSIKESSDPYILVLNNTYDDLWKARIDNQLIGKHFIVNGFANGWSIDKKGNYDIEIKLVFWPWD